MRGATSEKIELPKDFIKCSTFEENGKKFTLYYNPIEKDPLKAYIKKEADN